MPAASLVIPSRGGASRLPVLFASLERQSLQDFEAIVVVDGDVDDSASVVAAAQERLPVRAVVLPQNRGRAAALNVGFGAASGDVFIRVDDDLELEPDFVEHHVRLHREAAHGVVAMCRDIFPDTPYAQVYGRRADERIREAAFATPPHLTWRWWCGNVSATREDYQAVGNYDEDYRAYGWEDVDWGYRLHRLGRPIDIPTDFETLHHGPVTSARERAERAYHSGAARRLFERKHGAAALPPEVPPQGLWGVLVGVCASVMTDRTVPALGRLLDRVVHRLPAWTAEKSIALLVESAARAGRHRARRTSSRG